MKYVAQYNFIDNVVYCSPKERLITAASCSVCRLFVWWGGGGTSRKHDIRDWSWLLHYPIIQGILSQFKPTDHEGRSLAGPWRWPGAWRNMAEWINTPLLYNKHNGFYTSVFHQSNTSSLSSSQANEYKANPGRQGPYTQLPDNLMQLIQYLLSSGRQQPLTPG